jgi:putative Holliday junction resolvase
MITLGLDLGRRYIGAAITDEIGLTVHPFGAIERRSFDEDLRTLLDLLGERTINQVVVGLPINMDGSEGPMAQSARVFALRLEKALEVPVALQDERLSTFEARNRLNSGVRPSRRRRKKNLDANAAAVILESWLSANREPISS